MCVQNISKPAAYTAQLHIEVEGTGVWKKSPDFELYLCTYYNKDIIPASPRLILI